MPLGVTITWLSKRGTLIPKYVGKKYKMVTKKDKNTIVWVIGIIALLVMGIGMEVPQKVGKLISGEQSIIGNDDVVDSSQLLCDANNQANLTITVRNEANDQSSETYDMDATVFQRAKGSNSDESYFSAITDTTAGTLIIDCGYEYVIKGVSADGNKGNSSRFYDVVSGNAEIVDGELVFYANKASLNIVINSRQHAVLEMRMFDNINDAYMYDSGDNTNKAWELDGITYTSTTDNATAYTEADGIDFTLEARANESDTDFNDFGTYILLDKFDTNIWETPSVSVDGSSVSDITDQLTSSEKRGLNAYDYIYGFDKPVLDGQDGIDVRVTSELLAGASASEDLEIDLASKGAYSSIDGISVLRGSNKDDTSNTVVFAIQDTSVDIT